MTERAKYCGERHHRSKLTDEQVREILAQPKRAPMNWRKLTARRFNVSVYTIEEIRNGRGRVHGNPD